jgi:mannose-1-phosphate guanylyltransferase/phosphomannomutase
MYILDPAVFAYMEPGKNYDWSQDIFPRILDEGRPIYGYVMSDYWTDIGNLNQYREAQYTVLEGRTKIPVPGESVDGIWMGEGCDISPQAELLPPVQLGRNVKIKAGAVIGPYSVIGDNAIIEEYAVVNRSILWDNVYTGVGTRLEACTICGHVTLQRDCTVQEGAVIGERCRIERDSVIRSQIKLWPDKIIEAGSTVTTSLVWGQKWLGSLFRGLGVMGIANIELTPDFATKLASCFGAYLKRGSTVVTARDSGLASRMIKRAMISGLMSVGCNILDLRSMPLPIMRHMLRGTGAAGGMYVRPAPTNPRLLLIEFMDENGIYLSKAAERKLETIFFREDFGRADIEQIGNLEFSSRSVEQYAESYARHLNSEIIEAVRPKVVVDFSYGRLSTVFPQILGVLGCDVIALNAYVDATRSPKTAQARAAFLPNLTQIVQTLNADLGVIFQNNGERLTLVDETGNIIEDEMLLAVFCVLVARTQARARIGIPVTAPGNIETLVSLHGGDVRRSKADVRSLMALSSAEHAKPDTRDPKPEPQVHFAGDTSGGFIFSEFQPGFDSMYAFGKLLEMLCATGLGLAEIHRELPPVTLAKAVVGCPWEAKGRIMRELTRAAEVTGQVDLIDGIKIKSDGAWALILPDASEPYFHLYAEAPTRDESERLVREYANRIETLRA